MPGVGLVCCDAGGGYTTSADGGCVTMPGGRRAPAWGPGAGMRPGAMLPGPILPGAILTGPRLLDGHGAGAGCRDCSDRC